MRRATLLQIFWTLTLVASLGGMSVGAAAQTPTPVTIRLSWKIKGEDAPLYVAVEKGFYAKHGVRVRVLEGSGAGPTLTALVNGSDQFAWVSAVETVQGISQGMPIVMVANYVRKSPMVLASFSPLKSPQDLEGKTVGTTPADSFMRIWPAFAKANNIDKGKVHFVNLDISARIAQFVQGHLDVLSAFYTNEVPVIEAKTHRKLYLLQVGDYGFNLLDHGLVTTVGYAKQHPRLVHAAIAGTTEGFEDTLHHPTEAAGILVKLFPDSLERQITVLQIGNMLQLLNTKGTAGRPFGWNSRAEWERTVDVMAKGGLLAQRKPVREYYTNEFFPQ